MGSTSLLITYYLLLKKVFVTLSPNRPAPNSTETAPFGTLINGEDTYFGSKITYLPNSNYDNTVIKAIALDKITVSQSNLILDLSEIDNLVGVRIGNTSYTFAVDNSSPEIGEFVFDELTKTATVYLVQGESLERSSVLIQTEGNAIAVKTECLPIATEPLLAKWKVEEGKINLRFGFQTEPLGWSFTFQNCKQNENTIRQQLDNGSIHSCFGYQWVVTGLHIKDLKDGFGQIKVTVDLEYFLTTRGKPSRSPLDKVIKLRKKIGTNNFYRRRTLGEFASLAGVNYRGENLSVRISRHTSSTEFTTFRNLLQARAINAHGFVHYGSDRVEIRPWRTTRTHIINESDLRNEPTFDYLGQGSWLNGARLAVEYRNRKISLDFEETSENEGVKQEWIFTNCDNLFELYLASQKDVNGILRSPSVEILLSPGINHDVSETYNKEGVKVTRVNGTTTFEERIKTGYAFTSEDVNDIEITDQGNIITRPNTATFPQTYFVETHRSTSDWIFAEDGYLTDIKVQGRELARSQQETEKFEAV
ncbi:MAG: hypothetical protein AAGF26_17480, partial [Cyanobacteria bacterium P01_G01_bin.49]